MAHTTVPLVAAGFIGLGNIGKPMANNLLAGPFKTYVYDVVPAACAGLQEQGAQVAASPAEMAGHCQVIGVCVRDDADVERVFCGDDGLLSASKPGLVVAIHSTVRPETIRDMAARAAQHQVAVIDAPITGGASGAQNKTLCYMVGGDPALMEYCAPVFNTSAQKLVAAGELGAGMALKLCNNLMTYAEFVAVYEAMRLAKAAGLDPQVLKDVGAANGNITEQMSMFLMLHDIKPHMSAEEFTTLAQGYSGVAVKDLSVALELAQRVGEQLPGCERSLALIEAVYEDRYSSAGDIDPSA